MNPHFISIRAHLKLFKQPSNIGDVLEIEGELYVIVGIENFELVADTLAINYTCQLLKQYKYQTALVPERPSDYLEFTQEFHFSRLKAIQEFKLGSIQTVIIEGETQFYKLVEYTQITLAGLHLRISVSAKRMVPAAPDSLKKLYKAENIKRMQLTVL